MGLTASDSGSGKSFEPVDEAVHHAVCIWVYDIGTHFNEKFGKSIHKCIVGWELPQSRITVEKDGVEQDMPRMISKTYTLSLHEKAILRKDLQTWRGKAFTSAELKGFDISNLLGVNCQIQVIHNTVGEKTYANIATILPIGKGAERFKPENGTKFFSFEDGIEPPEDTPEWVLKIIQESDEYTGSNQMDEPPPPSDEDNYGSEEDVPF